MIARKIAKRSASKTTLLEIGELDFDGWIYCRLTSQDFKKLQDQADFSLANLGCRTSSSGKLYTVFVFCSRVALQLKQNLILEKI